MRERARWRAIGGCLTTAGAAAGLVTGVPAPAEAVGCQGHRVMNIVAHEDDDLLFMNPDIYNDISYGHCVQTVYLTAGDAGSSATYWKRRERGVRDAYATMRRVRKAWLRKTISYSGHKMTRFRLADDTGISLVFLRLPDGTPGGTGTGTYGGGSLQKLWDRRISSLTTVDGTSSYSRSDLISALAQTINDYDPDTIRAQDYTRDYSLADYSTGNTDGDHSDHHAAAYFAYQAERRYYNHHRITPYLGYPSSDHAVNVGGLALARKREAFFAYAAWDKNIQCRSGSCRANSPVHPWLARRWHYKARVFAPQPHSPSLRLPAAPPPSPRPGPGAGPSSEGG